MSCRQITYSCHDSLKCNWVGQNFPERYRFGGNCKFGFQTCKRSLARSVLKFEMQMQVNMDAIS